MGSPDSHYEDYYAVLEIECDADDVAIKRAYHKQAMRWHPDKNQENRDEAEVMFKAIAEVRSPQRLMPRVCRHVQCLAPLHLTLRALKYAELREGGVPGDHRLSVLR